MPKLDKRRKKDYSLVNHLKGDGKINKEKEIIKENGTIVIILGLLIAAFALAALIDFPVATILPLILLVLYLPLAYIHICQEKEYENRKKALQRN